jgi:cell division protein FtsW (lipid II flippase)
MVVGSLAGVAVLYELVSLAHRGQLEARMHDPTNVMLGAACLFIFGWGLALVAPRTARWFGMFIAAGAAAAGAIAASGTENAYAIPLFCVGLAAAAVVFASFRGEKQERKARTA